MTDERQRSALKVLYGEVLLAFEEALDEAEDRISPEPGSHLRKVKTWLENATSSLISWGIDARTDVGSLSAVEGTPLENEVRCTLCELQGQLEKIYEECRFREEVCSLPEHVTSIAPELSPIPYEDGLAANEDPMAIMSSLIGVLQDTVRPIRMIHASRKQEGPYRDLKRQIDDIYTQHIERRDRSELQRFERLSRLRLTNFKPMKKNETLGLADLDGQRVFVEWKPINPLLRSEILPRVEFLADFLNVPKTETFRSLSCKGIVEHDGKVLFVFNHPFLSCPEEPRSLLDLFSAKDGIEPPSLSDRIRLALQIARTVQEFHHAGWVHKSLRSENILFFPMNDASTVTSISDPVLAGFNFVRFGSLNETSEQPSADPKHDIYRHPSAMGEPSLRFSALMDVYSLGTVMLEIAEWRALRYIMDSVVDVGAEKVPLSKLAEVQPFLLSGRGKGGTSKLRTKMGDIYTSACLMCLGGKVEEANLDQDGGFEPRDSLLDVAVERLESCVPGGRREVRRSDRWRAYELKTLGREQGFRREFICRAGLLWEVKR